MVALSYEQLNQLLSVGREIARMEQRIGKHVRIPYDRGCYMEGPVTSEDFEEIVVQDAMYGTCRIAKPCTIEEYTPEEIHESAGDIDIPEGGAENSTYVTDTFEIESITNVSTGKEIET